MKTATVTWITYNNYGTELQAFALQNYIASLGVDNTIISDRLILAETHREFRNYTDNNKKVHTHEERSLFTLLKRNLGYYYKKFNHVNLINHFKKLYKDITVKKIRTVFYKNENAFERFKSDYLKIQYGIKRSELSKLNESYDLFICGSDQIWSLLAHNFDPFYYLDFVDKKKISYAASIGSNDIEESKRSILRDLLFDFDYISVREEETSKQLEKIIHKKVDFVADPVLLFDSGFWMKTTQRIKIRKKKYLLCYFLENKEWYFSYASNLATYLGIKMLLIPNRIEYLKNNNVCSFVVGPLEFVKLFMNADFVVTDSYHGSLFSLIFNKQFVYLKRFNDTDFDCQNIRIYSILDYLKLRSLIISKNEFNPCDLLTIDYSRVNNDIMRLRTHSRQFLKRCILDEE